MESKMNTGGSAFPLAEATFRSVQEGMTLRDYFAAAALQGFVLIVALEKGSA